MIRKHFYLAACLLLALAPRAQAQPSPPYEIVREDVDLEAAPDGRYWQSAEVHSRPLTSAGVEALQQITLTYTEGFERLDVHAYTLKKDGRRIDVPAGSMLQGHGETSQPGFEDNRTITVFFPNLEVGDQAVLITGTQQIKPWFSNIFAVTRAWPRDVVVKEATFAFTSEGKDSTFHITSTDVDKDTIQTAGDKTRHVWHFHNDTPIQDEADSVAEIADEPHVAITSLDGYSDVASVYADLFRDRAEVTPEIAKLAGQLTQGVSDRRAQARLLYDWVATHIRYVNIVLGAGGFLPHKAVDVLSNGYGDCKDHVMLLEALLAAKGIKSSAVLIRVGAAQYRLPEAPSPFLFDHLITYVPEFQLYLDSTARYAPFGVLPGSDAGKNVVIVASGKTAFTPPVRAAASTVSATSTVTLNADGSADTQTKIAATGDNATSLRALMAALPPDDDDKFFRAGYGPGSSGKFVRGNPEALDDHYDFGATYHVAHMANFPGPGALPAALAYKPMSFSQLVGQSLPPTRRLDYVCGTGTFSEDITATLPPGITVAALPPGKTVTVEGALLVTSYEQSAPNTVRERVTLTLDRPGPVCRAADYEKLRPRLSDMIGALMSQILYK